MAFLSTRRGSTVPKLYDPFNNFFGRNFMDVFDRDLLTTVPSVNVREEKDAYKVEMAVPGMKKEDFNIDVEGKVMTISCEKETENQEDDKGHFSRKEYNFSSFSRSFTLPDNADAEKITAKYNDGVLELNIAKSEKEEKQRAQQIKVQ